MLYPRPRSAPVPKPASEPAMICGTDSAGLLMPGCAERAAEVITESTSGTATLPTKLPAWNLLFEYLNVSMRKIAVPAPVAPHAANDCVDGMPKLSHPPSGSGEAVWSAVHPGRGPLIAPRIGPSTSNV